MKLAIDFLTTMVKLVDKGFSAAIAFGRKQVISLIGALDKLRVTAIAAFSIIGENAAERARIFAAAKREQEQIDAHVKSLHDRIDAEEKSTNGAARFKKVLDDRANAMGKLKVEINGTLQVLQKFNDFRQEQIDTSRAEENTLQNAIRLRGELNELLKDGAITQEVHDRTLARIDDIINKTNEWNIFTRRAAENMQDDLSGFLVNFSEGAFRNFKSFKEGMKTLAADFARTINRMVQQWLAAKILTAGFGFAGIDVSDNTRGFADGGRPPMNVPSIVGERGPEIFVPDTAGTIVPNEGIGGNTVAINITAMDSQDVMRSLEQNKRGITEMVFGTSRTYNIGTA